MKLCDILQVFIRSERDIILYLERAKHTTFFRGVAAVRKLDDCGARQEGQPLDGNLVAVELVVQRAMSRAVLSVDILDDRLLCEKRVTVTN